MCVRAKLCLVCMCVYVCKDVSGDTVWPATCVMLNPWYLIISYASDHRFRQLQMSADNRFSALQSELQMKRFECERSHVVQEQQTKDLRQCELEREKLQKKAEVLSRELWVVQNEGKLKVLELEAKVREQGERLDVYEKLEKEMDQVVMQAAEGGWACIGNSAAEGGWACIGNSAAEGG